VNIAFSYPRKGTAMNNLTNERGLQEQLEVYLSKACEAEARGDILEAERSFKLAVGCEALSVPSVVSALEYVRQTGPVYKQDQVVSPAADLPANCSDINDRGSHG
jgi:hypothetical protein